MKKFVESQEIFCKWRTEKYQRDCICMFQIHDNNVLIEKWRFSDTIAIVEIFSYGNGFMIYWQS